MKFFRPTLGKMILGFVIGVLLTVSSVFASDYDKFRGICIDRVPDQCHRRLQPHYCYAAHNRALCCATCQAYYTGQKQCPYGDRNTVIERSGRLFTCKTYVGFYGKFRCRDPSFNTQCCSSCNK